MMKILSTLFAVALVGPATLAFAEDPTANGNKPSSMTGGNAVEVSVDGTQAGDTAQPTVDSTTTGGKAEEEAGPSGTAEKAGNRAERSRDVRHQNHAKRDDRAVKHSGQAIEELERADPDLTRLFDGAAGYAVFATVGKGAVGVGGAHGNGVLYEGGTAIGKATLTQLTVGLQIGGQAYTEVIFFETDKALAAFKKGQFAMAAEVSAVVAAAGASANAKYVEGVSVFTLAKGGVMAEASVGGQKFTYRPYQKTIRTSSR